MSDKDVGYPGFSEGLQYLNTRKFKIIQAKQI